MGIKGDETIIREAFKVIRREADDIITLIDEVIWTDDDVGDTINAIIDYAERMKNELEADKIQDQIDWMAGLEDLIEEPLVDPTNTPPIEDVEEVWCCGVKTIKGRCPVCNENYNED